MSSYSIERVVFIFWNRNYVIIIKFSLIENLKIKFELVKNKIYRPKVNTRKISYFLQIKKLKPIKSIFYNYGINCINYLLKKSIFIIIVRSKFNFVYFPVNNIITI
jgi:hypothetical protein